MGSAGKADWDQAAIFRAFGNLLLHGTESWYMLAELKKVGAVEDKHSDASYSVLRPIVLSLLMLGLVEKTTHPAEDGFSPREEYLVTDLGRRVLVILG